MRGFCFVIKKQKQKDGECKKNKKIAQEQEK